jgi:ornithine carbamoyltransferase
MTLVCPQGHFPDAFLFNKAKAYAAESGGKLVLTSSIGDLGQLDAIYTDTWVSMGDEDSTKKAEILAKFAQYQVNHQMMASSGASIVMHCQPAHLEEEITTSLFDSDMSVVFQQAENRMWAQNAVLVTLLNPALSIMSK